MDIFDKYLLEELTTQYAKADLTANDYEELYMRFCAMDYLDEVQPYLLTMRYFGWGVPAQRTEVLSQLKEKASKGDSVLKGLYYDLLLSENNNDAEALENLRRMVQAGYTNIFTKEKTHIEEANPPEPETKIQPDSDPTLAETADEDVVVDYITFECNDYSGIYFTAGDVDYLAAKIYIKPIHGKKHVKIRSQIFLDEDAFSKVFSDEYDISPKTRWVKTQGWGNKNYTCYRDNIYTWVIEIDGKTTFSQKFRMYGGRLNQIGPHIKDVRLFASKASGALEADRELYKTAFDGNTLEYIYFKFIMDPPGEDMNVQIFLKVTYLEDNSVFRDKYFLQQLDEDTNACWWGIGFSKAGKWKKGLYQYSARIGAKTTFEGTFTIY